MKHIAVVGSGIAGLSAAWLLSRRYRVTLFERAPRLGGHTNTVDVELEGKSHPVDTGFLVFNHRTYPNLTALFDRIGVEAVESEMSFAVSLTKPDLEWAGSSLATVFGQPANLARPAFWGMLKDILRFNREAARLASGAAGAERSLGEYLAREGYGAAFRDWYLLPMAAAIWSCPTGRMLEYPVATLARFCLNHGLLQVFDRPRWLTVRNGAREYVRRLADGISHVRLGTSIDAVYRDTLGVVLAVEGEREVYDHLVLACHADQALDLLGEGATDAERAVLGAFRFQPNRAVLHTDERLLPRNRALWSAWNYAAGEAGPEHTPVSVSYLINRLQPLPFRAPVIVTLNPHVEPAPEKVLAEFDYEHPIFDRAAIGAQARLDEIQGHRATWFCGAWTGYGFHEDGLRSALRVTGALGVEPPWRAVGTAMAAEAA